MKEKREATCPKCYGTSGYEGYMHETHVMGGAWDRQPEAGDSGRDVRYSKMRCLDCGASFTLKYLNKLGLAQDSNWRIP